MTAPPSSGALRRHTFAARLLVAQALVLGAGALTTWVVASVVGPRIFHDHLQQAGASRTDAQTAHAEEAFASALLVATSLALLAAVAAALGVSWYFSRRVQRSITQVAAAASQIAAGRYDARVPDPELGAEFSMLADTYNALAQRLGSVETTRRRLLADLAHEMRTPLATVDAHLEAIEDGIRDPDQATLGVIHDSTRRLSRLAEDVATLSRAEEAQLAIAWQPVDSAALVEKAADAARDRFAAQGVQLHVELRCHDRIVVDPDRIGQVLSNLLDNALRHTPAGGTVSLGCARAAGWTQYTVTDSGEGIAVEHLPQVFDRFYRVDPARSGGGSGIGLSIAKALVVAHSGEISAASDGPGQGATFTVRLPCSDR